MNCHIAVEHEEDPLLVNEIKTEPQDVKSEIKTEAEECEDIDMKHETLSVINPITCIQTPSEVEETEGSLGKLLLDFKKQSQSTQVNGTDVDPCECSGVQTHDVCVSDHAEDNSPQTVERSFKCSVCHKCKLCCKPFLNKSHHPVNIPENTGEKSMTHDFRQIKYFVESNQSEHPHINQNHDMIDVCTLSNEKHMKCKACNKYLSKKSSLTRHLSIHINEKPFECNICNKSFAQKSSLIVHLRIHKNEKPFQCNICNKSFFQKPTLTRHVRIHNNEKPFECDICKKSFTEKSALIRHLRNHNNEKPFECNICNKLFAQNFQLSKHFRMHSNEKPFECNICNKPFSLKHNLITHLRIHNNERPFECNICNKSFTRKHHLTKHFRIHTYDRPFECNICNKSFTRKHHLTKHFRIHNNKESFEYSI